MTLLFSGAVPLHLWPADPRLFVPPYPYITLTELYRFSHSYVKKNKGTGIRAPVPLCDRTVTSLHTIVQLLARPAKAPLNQCHALTPAMVHSGFF